MNKINKFRAGLSLLFISFTLFGCVTTSKPQPTSSNSPSTSSVVTTTINTTSAPHKITEEEILDAVDKLEFNDKTVTYDGTAHSIVIENEIPSYISVAYFNNKQINVGEYVVSAVLVDKTELNLELPILTATLKIEKANINVTFEDQTFSYDGKMHSIYINEELPEGVKVNYTNNNQINVGSYEVTARFSDTTGNYNVPANITRTMEIVKDGKYHDVTILYEDGSNEHWVAKDGDEITSLPTSSKDGYTAHYKHKASSETITFPYTVKSDLILQQYHIPNIYNVHYCYEGEVLLTEQVEFDSEYKLIESYLYNDKMYLVEFIIDQKTYERGSIIKYTYLEDLNIEMVMRNSDLDYTFTISNNQATITGYKGTQTNLILPEFVISNGKEYEVTAIGANAFKENKSIVSVHLPSTITTISNHAFYYCENLESINIPDGVTQIGKYAFKSCKKLESITLPEGITSIENSTFDLCKALTSIDIPEGVKSIGEYAFIDCVSLTKVVLPSTLENVYWSAFSNCPNIEGVYIKDIGSFCNVDFYHYSSNPLYYAKNLYINNTLATDIVIPNDTTTIRAYVFPETQNIKTVVMPTSVTKVETYAFYDCSNMKVFVEHYSQPSGWESNWGYVMMSSGFSVYYKNNWEYVGGVPTVIK